MPRDDRNLIVVDARVARDEEGQPLASPEIVVVRLPRESRRPPANVKLRGVSPRLQGARRRSDRRRAGPSRRAWTR